MTTGPWGARLAAEAAACDVPPPLVLVPRVSPWPSRLERLAPP